MQCIACAPRPERRPPLFKFPPRKPVRTAAAATQTATVSVSDAEKASEITWRKGIFLWQTIYLEGSAVALGGLVGGLANSGLVPKDTPEGKLFAAQSELSGLQKQEADILAEIGRAGVWAEPGRLAAIR